LAGAHFNGAEQRRLRRPADLTDADFIEARVKGTTFESTRLTGVRGLASATVN
jgi:hypothetical protein